MHIVSQMPLLHMTHFLKCKGKHKHAQQLSAYLILKSKIRVQVIHFFRESVAHHYHRGRAEMQGHCFLYPLYKESFIPNKASLTSQFSKH